MKRNFLVIGGTKGLGYSIAEKLSFEDHEIIITGRSSRDFLEEKIECPMSCQSMLCMELVKL